MKQSSPVSVWSHRIMRSDMPNIKGTNNNRGLRLNTILEFLKVKTISLGIQVDYIKERGPNINLAIIGLCSSIFLLFIMQERMQQCLFNIHYSSIMCSKAACHLRCQFRDRVIVSNSCKLVLSILSKPILSFKSDTPFQG